MRSPRYPLEPLAQMREQRVAGATRAVAASLHEREASRRARQVAEERQESHRRLAAKVREAEAAALRRGELVVGDLEQAGRWALETTAEENRLATAVARALANEARADELVRRAQELLASCRAEAMAVERDRARWVAGRRRASEGREEEGLLEAWRRPR